MYSTYTDSIDFYGHKGPDGLLREFGSPLYVYNERLLRERALEMAHLVKNPRFFVSYSTKANANPTLLRILRSLKISADAMSPGELALVKMAGYGRDEICYICNNAGKDELLNAYKSCGLVGVDSLSQLESFCRVAPDGNVMLRLNPGLGAGHHQKVITAGSDTKFGMSFEEALEGLAIVKRSGVKIVGLNQHIGSLFMEGSVYLQAAEWLLSCAEHFPDLQLVDFGGGFGIPYNKLSGQPRLDLQAFGAALGALIDSWVERTGYSGRFCIEPGRYIVGESAALLGTVLATKQNGSTRFVGTDIGFSVLIRPVLYDAHHDIELYQSRQEERPLEKQTVVGNICESGDILAKDRLLPLLKEGDIIGVLDAGAYCMSMASNYNQRFRPAEVLIKSDGSAALIRKRETEEDLLKSFSLT